PTVTARFFTSARAKPGAETVTVYWPGVRAISRYSPFEPPGAVRAVPFAWSIAITLALVTSCPPGSFTVTRTSPVAAPCAPARTVQHTITKLTQKSFRISFIYFSLGPPIDFDERTRCLAPSPGFENRKAFAPTCVGRIFRVVFTSGTLGKQAKWVMGIGQ